MKRRIQQTKPRYRVEMGKVCIEINLRNPKQLFDMRDPAPFIDRDLDDDAVDYIVSAAQEFSMRTPLKLVLHFQEPETQDLGAKEVRQAIRAHFLYQAELLRRKSERTIKLGRLFLVVGLFFLFTCLFLARLSKQIRNETLASALREGMTITGWVAMWRPLQLFLYDWIPDLEQRKYYLKLANIEVSTHFTVRTAA